MFKLLACLGFAVLLAFAPAARALNPQPDLLTPEERQWLVQHGPLRYAPDPSFPPFEFFRQNGELAGITPEILEIVARNLGTTIQPIRYSAWPAVLEGIKRGDCDLLGTLTRTTEREAFLDYTSAYLSVPNVLYVNETSSLKTGFDELAGRRVGVVLNSGAHSWLNTHHPEVHIVPATNTQEALKLLSLNQLDAVLEALPVAGYVISENAYTNLRALPEIVFTVPQHLATRKGQSTLRVILEKGLASVPVEERMRIFSRWTGEDPSRPKHLVPSWVWKIGAFLLLAVAGFAAWNTSLRRIVARRTHDLQESESHFRRLLEDLPVAAATAAADGRVEFLNRKFTAQFGYTRADLPTLHQWAVLAYPDETYRAYIMARWASETDRARQANVAPPALEVQATCRDGSVRTVSIVTRTIGNKFFALFDDLTERAQMEQQLRQAQKMEAIGQLAGGVAHDFNNLLTVIQCNSDLLMEDPAVRGNARQSVQQIAEVSQRAANLTRQLLTFSRQQAMKRQVLSLNDVVASAYKLLSRILGEQVAVDVGYGTALPPINADAGMLEQVLINLAVNSRDAMPRGGQLTISTRLETVGEADLARRTPLAKTGTFVVLAVADSGSGITPQEMPHLFEPFYTTKDIGKGTGLGLATVYGIVQQHDGWIEVDSVVGEGTTMNVYLPVAVGASAKARHEAWRNTPLPGGAETILLVEDEAMVRDLAKRCLTHAGYQVLEAANATEALALWPQHRDQVALLFTDMVMPGGLDGRELAARLLQDKPTLKVIYASGYSRSIRADDPEWINRVQFVSKPFDLSQLLTVVRQSLDDSKQTS